MYLSTSIDSATARIKTKQSAVPLGPCSSRLEAIAHWLAFESMTGTPYCGNMLMSNNCFIRRVTYLFNENMLDKLLAIPYNSSQNIPLHVYWSYQSSGQGSFLQFWLLDWKLRRTAVSRPKQLYASVGWSLRAAS